MDIDLKDLAFPFKLWPPSSAARLVHVNQITKRLFLAPALSTSVNLYTKEEAKEVGIEIEEMAFAAASKKFKKEHDSEGVSTVQCYSKLAAELTLEYITRGPTIFVFKEHDLLTAKDAQVLLMPLVKRKNSCTKICFSNMSFLVSAAHVAKGVLVTLKDQLTEVQLSNFVSQTPEDEVIQVMEIFSDALKGCSLKSLDLSNNFMGAEGISAFDALLKSQSSLEELYLMNIGIFGEEARVVCELIPSTQKLKVFHFDNDMIGDEGAVAIAKVVKSSPALEDFRCSFTCVGKAGGFALTEALGTCTNLKKLNLSGNMFRAVGMTICKAVSLHGITEIYLSYMHLGDCVASAIANVLKDNTPSLEVLDMAGNNITVGAVSELAACITSKEFLTKLNLSDNELKNEGAIMIGKALEEGHGQLKEVDLSLNIIGIDGARFLAQTMVHKPKFQLLNLNGNNLSPENIGEVNEIWKKTPTSHGDD